MGAMVGLGAPAPATAELEVEFEFEFEGARSNSRRAAGVQVRPTSVPAARPSARRRAGFRASLILAVFAMAVHGSAQAQTGRASVSAQSAAETAFQALTTGDYDDAETIFRRLTETGRAGPGVWRGYVRTLVETGAYEDAETVARAGVEAHGAELENVLGEVLVLRGRRAEAEASFRAALDRATDRVDAALNLALLQWDRGERDAAMAAFDGFIDLYNRSRNLTSEELAAVATAVRHLGREQPSLFRDALRAYDEAIAADSSNHEARVLLGEMFLEKYNSQDARSTFEAVLDVNPRHARALVGLAEVLAFDNQPGAAAAVDRALEVNPSLVPAHVHRARAALIREDYAAAEQAVAAALAVQASSLEARSVRAAAWHLQGDGAGYAEARDRVLELNPGYAELFNTMAELSVQHRQYEEAVRFAERALALDSTSWRAWGILGVNRLRTRALPEARPALERAFAGDPYNVWIKNTLDLLDTFADYAIVETEHFELVLHTREAGVLGPYVAEIAERAYARLADRYGYTPEPPIRVEVYPRHADFSVRTVGLTGMGALGVSFGPIVVMDSPSAREQGSFNWASTLWHELAHTVHLGLSDHEVPRWFTEGLSVLEQRRARPGWDLGIDPSFVRAYSRDMLLPVSDLNDGFVRPRYPGQILHAYYEASLVCEMIEERFGFPALRGMLDAHRGGATTAGAFEAVLGMDAEAMDDAFEAYLDERIGPVADVLPETDDGPPHAGARTSPPGARRPSPADAVRRADERPDDFAAQLLAGATLLESGDPAAERYLQRAAELYPAYPGQDGPRRLLARLYRQRGEPERVVRELERLVALGEPHYAAHLELAELYESLGNRDGAARVLDRAMLIYPFEIPVHERLARLHEARGDWEGAVRERTVILALDPADRAAAHYRLARAHAENGERDAARFQVLRALEIAPDYDEALELLLRVRGGGHD